MTARKAIYRIWCMVLILSLIPVWGLRPESASAAVQAAYYVSPTGSDSNSGTIAAPFKTLDKARQTVRTVNGSMTGDIVVYFRGGSYPFASPVTFNAADSGTNGFNIYYQAYPGETPVFEGGTKVQGWSVYSGNIYKAVLNRNTKLRTLYVNDQRAVLARGPIIAPQGGYGTYSIAGTESWAYNSGSEFSGIKFSSSDLGAYANAADAELVNQVGFSFHVIGISSIISNGTSRVAQLQMPMGAIAFAEPQEWGMAFYQINNNPPNHFYVQNAFELLDQPGEFYFNKSTNTLFYYKRSTDNMSTADVYAPLSEGMIRLEGTSKANRVHHLVFQGIKFAHDHWSLMNVAGSVGATAIQANSMLIKYLNSGDGGEVVFGNSVVMPATFQASNASNIQLIRNTFEHLGAGAVSYGNDTVDSAIVGNRFIDISGSAISVGDPLNTYIGDGDIPIAREGAPTNIAVNNNYIEHASAEFLQTVPIIGYYADGLAIENNLISYSPYTAISLGWGWNAFYALAGNSGRSPSDVARNNKINRNKIVSSMKLLHDGAAIYTLGAQPGSEIIGNYTYDMGGTYSGSSIYTDQSSSGFEIAHNVSEKYNGVWFYVWGEGAHVSNLNVHDNFADTVTGNEGAYATSSTIKNTNRGWSALANRIGAEAGIKPAYADIVPAYAASVPLRGQVEAETGTLQDRATVAGDTSASNGQVVAQLDTVGTGVSFANVAKADRLTIRYASVNTGSLSVYVNGVKQGVINFASTGAWYGTYANAAMNVSIPAGATIKLQNDTGDSGLNLDNIVLSRFQGGGILEAEAQTLFGRAESTTDGGASNGQMVSKLDLIGDGISFVQAAQADQLVIRYASMNTGHLSVYVNGSKQGFINFTSTGAWSGTYGTAVMNVAIPAGATVTLQNDTGDSGLNLDYVTLNRIQSGRLEAENQTMLGRATVGGDGAASGGQIVIQLDLVGDGIEFGSVAAASNIAVRYAAAASGHESLYVNGVKVGLINFTSTGSWYGTYNTVNVSASIPAGATITIKNDSGDTGFNLDYIQLS